MTEQVGGIEYQVDMDTAAVTKGADRINAALDSVGKGAGRLDTQLGRVDKGLVGTGKASSNAASGVEKLDKATGKATISAEGFGAKLTPLAAAIGGLISVQALASMGKMAEQFTLLQSRIARLTPDLDTANRTYQQLLTVAAQTGQTMPETVKLWETLTSSLKALGATNGQVVTLTATLQKIGKIGGSSAEETSNALRQLGQSLAGGTLRAEEFNSIVEQTPELVRQLATAAGMSMGEFRQAMLDGKVTSQELFDLLISRTQSVDTEFKKLPRSVADAANAITVQMGAALSAIDKATKASRALAFVLDGIAEGIRTTFNPSDQEQFNKLLRDRATAQQQYETQLASGLKVTAAATKVRIDGLNAEIKKMQDARIEAIKAEAGPTRGPAAEPAGTSDGQKAIQQLAEQNQQLRAQGVERAKIIALQKLGAGATQQEKDAAVALAVENFNMQEAEKARAKAKTEGAAAASKAESEAAALIKKENEEARKGYEDNQKAIQAMATELANAALKGEDLALAQARAKLNKFASPEDVAEVERLTRAIVAQQEAVANKQLAGQVDPMVGAQQGLDKQLADIQTLEQAQIISAQRANELRLASETAYQEQVRVLQEETFRQASLGNQLMMASIDALAQSGTQALSGLLSGTTSLKDAMGGIANTVLNTVIGSFVQMGVDWVKQQIMMQGAAAATTAVQTTGIGTVAGVQAGATASMAATTTSAAATTGTAVAGSMAPAAGLASIASFGGAAVIGGAALLATMLLAKSFGGGRQYGGPVAGNKMYRVNEGGAPEIFNAAGGKQYMMPNSRGEVVSNKDASAPGGGGGAPIVNVNNYTGQTASASSRYSEADRAFIVDVIVGDMRSGGASGQAANQITGTRRRGS